MSFYFVKRFLVLSAIADSPDRHLRINFFSQIIAFALENLQIYYPCDPTTALIPKTSKKSPVSLAFFYCLTFSLVLRLLTSTFTAFPMFLKVFGCLKHTNNCYIFSISWSKWPERNKINLYSRISLDSR